MTYEEHYTKCQEEFSLASDDKIDVAYTIDIVKDVFKKTTKYYDKVCSLRTKFEKCLKENKALKKTKFAVNHTNPLSFPEVTDIIEEMYENISINIFNCNFTTNKISLYKSIHCDSENVDNTWKWHWDNNPRPHMKLFIYLTDVEENTAPLAYLRNNSGSVIKMETSKISPNSQLPPKYKNSRFPNHKLEEHMASGFYSNKVCGPAGTYIIFDPNIVHKATIPAIDKSRLALVYHMHPIAKNKKFYNFNNIDVKKYNLL